MKYVLYFTEDTTSTGGVLHKAGEIRAYGDVGEPFAMPDTDPEVIVVPYDLIAVPEHCAKMAVQSDAIITDETHYVDVSGTPSVIAKPTFDSLGNSIGGDSPWVANGVSSISYGPNIPTGTDCLVSCRNPAFGEGFSETITTGEIEIATPIEGLYEIRLTKFPYLTKVITVTAEVAQ